MNPCKNQFLNGRKLDYVSQLGRGTFGIVYKAVDLATGEVFAVKCSRKTCKFVSREYEILCKLEGTPNCVKLLDIFYTVNEEKDATQHLVFEYVPDSLARYLKRLKELGQCLKFEEAVKIMQMILKGLQGIHSRGVMHRDIKPENILINPATLDVKICDFGSAKLINESENIPFVVSKAYRAPELTLQCRDYQCEIDIWSAGCIFIEFFTGRSLFLGRTDGEQIYHQVKVLGPIPETCPVFQNSYLEKSILRRINSFGEKRDLKEFLKNTQNSDQLADLLQNMLNYDQNSRFSASDCLDDVLGIEEKAFQEGVETGKNRARDIAEKESYELGKENGFFIAREYGFIIGFTEVVNLEEHIREKHLKIINDILQISIEPTMPDHEINSKMLKLRSLFKVLQSVLKLNLRNSGESELF